VDDAVVTIIRTAICGSGDIAILCAAQLMEWMPLAPIATRIGGMATVAMALAAVGHLAP
jgi:Na+/citrate or Na+/malate symporter